MKRSASEVERLKRSSEFLFNEQNFDRYQKEIHSGLNLLKESMTESDQPFNGILPSELTEKFKQLDLDKALNGSEQALAELKELYLDNAIYFHNPNYVAHLNCPIVYPSLLAELILSAINTSVDTWDQSAGGTLIEQKVIDWTRERIGFDDEGDGVFTSGGTQSNLMAITLARDFYCDQHLNGHSVQLSGLPSCADKFRIFTSKLSHFSVQKSAALLGLGHEAVVPVDHDEDYRMDVNALEQEVQACIAAGLIPIAVIATTGTTDFGSIDPVAQISKVCTQHNMWLHADAAYGCGLLISNEHRDKLKDIHYANSVTVDYHKSFFQPVSCGAFFAKNHHHLGYLTYHAEYLNPLSAQQEGTPNLVNKSLQTTRRFDALKVWLTLRVMGADRLGEIFDEVMYRAQEGYELLNSDGNIDVLHQPELSTLVFRFHPAHSELHPIKVTDELLDDCNHFIRKRIFRDGRAVIAGTKVNGHYYLKFTLLNPQTGIENLEAIIELIKHYGHEFISGCVTEIEHHDKAEKKSFLKKVH